MLFNNIFHATEGVITNGDFNEAALELFCDCALSDVEDQDNDGVYGRDRVIVCFQLLRQLII